MSETTDYKTDYIAVGCCWTTLDDASQATLDSRAMIDVLGHSWTPPRALPNRRSTPPSTATRRRSLALTYQLVPPPDFSTQQIVHEVG